MWILAENVTLDGRSLWDVFVGSTGVLGAIGPVATLAVNWLKDRDLSSKKLRLLDEAVKRVAFWSEWLKAIKPLDSGDERRIWEDRARKELLSVSSSVELLSRVELPPSATLTGDAFSEMRQRLPWWRRWFLLYVPSRGIAWLPRVFFYMYVIGTGPAILASFEEPVEGVLNSLEEGLLMAVYGIVVLLLFRWWSVSLEKPKKHHS